MTTSATPTAAEELRELTRLGFEELRHAAGGIGRVHQAIADRAFGLIGAPALPVRTAHDAIAAGVYGAVRGGTWLAGRAAVGALERRTPGDRPPLSATPGGAFALAAITGLVGDALEEQGSALQAPMAVRVGGEMVAPDREALAGAFPDARSRLVVFLHGLMETEFSWRLGGRPSYGERLRADLGCTPVDVRFNTGRHISVNGRDLADLLGELVAAWPVGVEEIALVGHSMGGLVARSACHHAKGRGDGWVEHVRHVVSLGSPHLGAPLEQAVHVASAALHALPETRPFGAFLRRRSAGIRDLRQGSLVDEDWDGRDPEALRAAACAEVPLLEGVAHCFVTATVTRDPKHPLGRVLGDVLVLQGSGAGRSRRRTIGFREEDGLHIGGASHFALLNHPDVYDQLLVWLRTPPARIET